jgi:hypothetical protein
MAVSKIQKIPNAIPSAYQSITKDSRCVFSLNDNMGVLYVARGNNNAMYIFDYWTARSTPSSGSVVSGVTVSKKANSRDVTIKNTTDGAIALLGLNGILT